MKFGVGDGAKLWRISKSFEFKDFREGKDAYYGAGYVSTEDIDLGGEIVLADAFRRYEANYRANPVYCFQHNPIFPIGRVEEFHIEQGKGLSLDSVKLLKDNFNEEFIIPRLHERIYSQQSIGFIPVKGYFDKSKNAYVHTEVLLLECSLVSIAMNPATDFALKGIDSSDEISARALKMYHSWGCDTASLEVAVRKGIDVRGLELPAAKQCFVFDVHLDAGDGSDAKAPCTCAADEAQTPEQAVVVEDAALARVKSVADSQGALIGKIAAAYPDAVLDTAHVSYDDSIGLYFDDYWGNFAYASVRISCPVVGVDGGAADGGGYFTNSKDLSKQGNSAYLKGLPVDKDSSWSFSADDGNALVDDGGIELYAKVHLAKRSDENADTKGAYAYPVAKLKSGKVTLYRAGVIAAKQRAAQQGESSIEAYADSLLTHIDGESSSAKGMTALLARYNGLDTFIDLQLAKLTPEVAFDALDAEPLEDFGPKSVTHAEYVHKRYLLVKGQAGLLPIGQPTKSGVILDWKEVALSMLRLCGVRDGYLLPASTRAAAARRLCAAYRHLEKDVPTYDGTPIDVLLPEVLASAKFNDFKFHSGEQQVVFEDCLIKDIASIERALKKISSEDNGALSEDASQRLRALTASLIACCPQVDNANDEKSVNVSAEDRAGWREKVTQALANLKPGENNE
jgi:hypothetical protein